MPAARPPAPQPAPAALSARRRARLESTLLARMRELDRRLANHHGGASRVENAHEMLEPGTEDAAQHAMAREVDQSLSDLEMRELDALGNALARLHSAGFGRCTDCGSSIPFERLLVEPQAERCLACQSRLEGHQALTR